jgi:spore maturation protein SpmB
MKKVLFFIESLSGGGAEKVLSDLVSNLDKTKYEVTVATITNGGVYEKTVSAECNYYSFLDTKTYGKGIFKKLLYFFRYRWIYKSPAEKVYKKIYQR